MKYISSKWQRIRDKFVTIVYNLDEKLIVINQQLITGWQDRRLNEGTLAKYVSLNKNKELAAICKAKGKTCGKSKLSGIYWTFGYYTKLGGIF